MNRSYRQRDCKLKILGGRPVTTDIRRHRVTNQKVQAMQVESTMLRKCGAILAIALLSHLTVHYAYAAVGGWPPYWTAVIASYFLASIVWLLVLLSGKATIGLAIERYSIQRVLGLMTVVAIFFGGTRLMGFYPALFTFLTAILLASLVNFKSNPLYLFRRNCLPRAPRLLHWLPGFLVGLSLFAALHVYDLQVRMLNKGRFELSLSLCTLALFCALLGAFCQFVVI